MSGERYFLPLIAHKKIRKSFRQSWAVVSKETCSAPYLRLIVQDRWVGVCFVSVGDCVFERLKVSLPLS